MTRGGHTGRAEGESKAILRQFSVSVCCSCCWSFASSRKQQHNVWGHVYMIYYVFMYMIPIDKDQKRWAPAKTHGLSVNRLPNPTHHLSAINPLPDNNNRFRPCRICNWISSTDIYCGWLLWWRRWSVSFLAIRRACICCLYLPLCRGFASLTDRETFSETFSATYGQELCSGWR